MSIKWPLNGQFHNAVTNVLTSQMDFFEVVDVDDDEEPTLGTQK